jgi:hypothetical protein
MNPFRIVGRVNGKPVRAYQEFNLRLWALRRLAGKRMVLLNAVVGGPNASVEAIHQGVGGLIANNTITGRMEKPAILV